MRVKQIPREPFQKSKQKCQPINQSCIWILILLVSQALEDLHHGVSDGVNHFVVMVAEGHLNIQTHKLSQVTVGVGVLRPENWDDADLISNVWTKQAQLEERWQAAIHLLMKLPFIKCHLIQGALNP